MKLLICASNKKLNKNAKLFLSRSINYQKVSIISYHFIDMIVLG